MGKEVTGNWIVCRQGASRLLFSTAVSDATIPFSPNKFVDMVVAIPAGVLLSTSSFFYRWGMRDVALI